LKQSATTAVVQPANLSATAATLIALLCQPLELAELL